MNPDCVTVDVIIPVYKPGEQLKELFLRLLSQDMPIQRIIIVNTEKKYWKEEPYRPMFQDKETVLSVYHVSKEEFDHGGTRHMGILKSNAKICLCMTQDALPEDSHLIRCLVSALISKEYVVAAYARQLPTKKCGTLERYTRMFNYPEQSRIKTKADLDELGIKTYFCSNVCAAYKRELYLKLGGFIKKTIFNEDMIFAGTAIKAGFSIAYAADARVIHSHNYTGMEQLHRNFDLAVSQADHPEIFSGIRSEGEGLRLVRQTAGYLVREKKGYLLPELVVKSGFKYIGYRLGKAYRSLPRWMIRKLTMNEAYWK